MANGVAVLDLWVRRLRTLPKQLVLEAAPAAARAFDGVLHEQIAAGQAPDGTAWKPTAEGERPLKNAGDALTVRAIGTVLLARLEGPEARHHKGTARGRVVRRILPSRAELGAAFKAIKPVIGKAFKTHMTGGA